MDDTTAGPPPRRFRAQAECIRSAGAVSRPTAPGDEEVRLAESLKQIRYHATPLNSDNAATMREELRIIRGIANDLIERLAGIDRE